MLMRAFALDLSYSRTKIKIKVVDALHSGGPAAPIVKELYSVLRTNYCTPYSS